MFIIVYFPSGLNYLHFVLLLSSVSPASDLIDFLRHRCEKNFNLTGVKGIRRKKGKRMMNVLLIGCSS